jgi:hypothetical protein
LKISQDKWDKARVTIFEILNDWENQDPAIRAQMQTLTGVMRYDITRFLRAEAEKEKQ